MDKLTEKKAKELLFLGVIENESDLTKSNNRWILHCLYVGCAAKRIASKLGIDEDYAAALGYIHDIGRKINHQNHPIEGYNYIKKHGFNTDAKICLTHSFIDNNINLVAGGPPKNDQIYTFLNNFLQSNKPSIYDSIVQLCDLFCLEKGFTTLEKRILDIYTRKGIYENSLEHFHSALALKEQLENQMGCNLYDLFPEINKEDTQSIQDHKEQILKLIDEQNKKKKQKR